MSERDDRSAHDGGADDPGGESNQTSPTLRRLLAVSVGVLGFGLGGMVFGGLLSNILFVLEVVALSATVLVSLVVAAGRAIFTSVDSARPWLSGAVAALVGGGLLV
ncbi:MAG: hypothetical protein ABEL76_05440, partial [Bradymonadaceae bacterium]